MCPPRPGTSRYPQNGRWRPLHGVAAFPRQLARWMDAAVGETLPALQAAFRHAIVDGAVAAVTVTAPVGRVFTSGSIAVPTPSVAGELTVKEPKADLFAGLSPGQILALTLIWVVAYALPFYLYAQSPSASTLIEADLSTVSLAYSIQCQILSKRKEQ